MSITRILIADAQPLFAEALGVALDRESDFSVVQKHPVSGPEVVEEVVTERPDVCLIDFWMPEMSGPAVTNSILARGEQAKVILLSWFHGVREIQNTFNCGAVGFLPKSVKIAQVAEAVRWARDGLPLVYPKEMEEIIRTISGRNEEAAKVWERFAALTPREIQILDLLGHGRPLKEMAETLSISHATMRTHVQKILEKTKTHTQMEAVALARKYGLIQS